MKANCHIKKMIVDEADLITYLDLQSPNLQHPAVDKLFLTGGVKQLPSNTGSLPEKIMFVEHDSSINKLRKTIVQIRLRNSYCSRSTLTKIVLRVLYNSKLIPVLTNQEKNTIKADGISLPVP